MTLRLTSAIRSRLARGPEERGTATLEWVVIAPGALLIMAFLALAGRVALANGVVEQAAADAARAASLARGPASAEAAANEAAELSLTDQGLECLSTTVDVNTAGFHTAPGQAANVSVTITCPIRVLDLPIPGVGPRTAISTAISPIDTYRER